MRKYVFKFRDYDLEDDGYKDHVKYVDKLEPIYEVGRTDLEEFVEEAQKFLLARGFHPDSVSGVVYLDWKNIKYKNPDYNEEYLVTLKDKEYTTVARYEDGKWNIDENLIEAWAEMPTGYGR